MTTAQNFTRRGDKGIPGNPGKFAHPDRLESGTSLTPAAIPGPHLYDRTEARDRVKNRLMAAEDANDREEYERLDPINQQYSLNLAAARILVEYPEATAVRISENDDGENQFDLREATLADGTKIPMDSFDGFGEDSSVGELMWNLSRHDTSWADGVASDISNKFDGKTFDINLAAVLARPLPPVDKPGQSVADILARREETREIQARLELDQNHYEDVERRNNVALISAHLLDHYPTAKTLFIEQNDEDPAKYDIESIADDRGDILASARDDLLDEEQPAGRSNDDLDGFLRSVSPYSDSWAEGIAVSDPVDRGLNRFAINLRAAVSAPPLAHPDAGNPRRKPLTHQEQDDLVEAAYYGLGDIEDSLSDLDDDTVRTNREQLLDRLNQTLTHAPKDKR